VNKDWSAALYYNPQGSDEFLKISSEIWVGYKPPPLQDSQTAIWGSWMVCKSPGNREEGTDLHLWDECTLDPELLPTHPGTYNNGNQSTQSLPQLNTANDTVLLNTVRKVGKLVVSRTCYMLLCGNKALKQNTAHSSMVYYVHALLYNAAKQVFHYIKSYYNL
jgi:hypothetical protein